MDGPEREGDMDAGEKLMLGLGVALLGSAWRSARKEARETERRRRSKATFGGGVTYDDFVALVGAAAKRTPRLEDVRIDGLDVTLQVRSNSGLSRWSATIDFNDYGRLTGKYWLTSENHDSVVPRHFAEEMQRQIVSRRVHGR